MTDNPAARWDERYRSDAYAYGTLPNQYLRQQLEKWPPGSILFAAEGEGRNAVYAAKQGWKVSAFDISAEGKKKALLLAQENNQNIDYRVGELPELSYQSGQFDAIALIYAHFPPGIKSDYHRLLHRYLRPGGVVIFEAFSKKHIDYVRKDEKVGGPRDIDSLFSTEELEADFPGYSVVELTEQEIELQEGLFHNGTGSVLRFTGIKP